MDQNRRNFLQMFGIGATIIPVLGGVPKIELPAKLIEEPKIEPIEVPATNLDTFSKAMDQEAFISVQILTKDGQRHQFSASTFILEMKYPNLDIMVPLGSNYGHYAGSGEIHWSMTGICAEAIRTNHGGLSREERDKIRMRKLLAK